MILESLEHAVPGHSMTGRETWDLLLRTKAADGLRSTSRRILEKILCGDSGIDRRHFATDDPAALFQMHPGELNAHFEREAPRLAADALSKAMRSGSVQADEIDALYLCTCTGYLCPGPTSYVAEALGLRPDCVLHDLVGLGCGAAIPALRAAHAHLAAHPAHRVAVVAVEICSAALFLDDDRGVLVSFCLFGDAASASLWTATPRLDRPAYRLGEFRSLHLPAFRDQIRFQNHRGFLRNQLARSVPALAADAVHRLAGAEDDAVLISHPGGKDVLDAIASLPPHPGLLASREAMRRFGNCSSPTVLLALEIDLARSPETRSRSLVGFGAGFSCHAAQLDRVQN